MGKGEILIATVKAKVVSNVRTQSRPRFIRFEGKKIKTLPREKKLIDDLYEAYYKGGLEFSKLKKKIEKITGLKVKVFQKQVLDKNRNPIKIFDVKMGKWKNYVILIDKI